LPLNGGAIALGYIGLFHGLAIVALRFPFKWAYLPIMIGLYLWMGFGISLYLHRYLAHRSFEMAEPLKVFLALGTALGMMRNPVWWAGQHRIHHRRADRPGDVHSPREGLFHAHVGWILRVSDHVIEHLRAARDVPRTWYTRLFGSTAFQLGLNLAVAGGLFVWGGLGAALWCLYVPLVAYLNVAWSVNSLGHRYGYRSHETPDDSRNGLVLGILALGEGYHNNHHAFPQLASAGRRWYEPDASSTMLWLFERLGWVWDVRWQLPHSPQDA
jgi:stearoyl-CoA desaturase (delta-9 desaturase)